MSDWDALTGAREEAMDNAISGNLGKLIYDSLSKKPPKFNFMPPDRKRKRCSHPKQSYRGDHWYCMECGKKMP